MLEKCKLLSIMNLTTFISTHELKMISVPVLRDMAFTEGCCNPGRLVASIWPLEVVSSCIWPPAPAAMDTGIDSSCWAPFPVRTINTYQSSQY